MRRTTVTYDSALIYQFAEGLYAQARRILVSYPITGGILGLAAGLGAIILRGAVYVLAGGRGGPTELGAIGVLLALAAVGALIGRSIALDRAFQLRLRAQLALCNVAIEENTRAISNVPRRAERPREVVSGV